jgi:hypothetical protein
MHSEVTIFNVLQCLERNFRASSMHYSSRPFGGTMFYSLSDSTIFSRSKFSIFASYVALSYGAGIHARVGRTPCQP